MVERYYYDVIMGRNAFTHYLRSNGMNQHAFLLTALDLKREGRTAWEEAELDHVESVAGHSWGVALLTVLHGTQADVDVGHAVQLAVVHDVAESITGDIISADKRPNENRDHALTEQQKHHLEERAMERLAPIAGDRAHVRALWEEYEARESDEARFVKDMDTLELAYQTVAYQEADAFSDAPEPYDDIDDLILDNASFYTETAQNAFEKLVDGHDTEKETYRPSQD